ncbi:MAG: hypothetical protein ACREOY_01160 [Candidatus Dormibacteraceae bacterium]
MISSRRFYASVAVLGGECVACFFAGYSEWGDRGGMVGINSAEAAEQAQFAIELYAIGALNLVSVAFLLRRAGWSWWLVLGVQVGVFVFALIEGALTDIGWFYFSGFPLLTFILLFTLRTLKSPVERNLTPYATP